MRKKIFLLVLSVLMVHVAKAEEIDKEFVGLSKNPDVQEARNEILENAQKETIGNLIIQMIGRDKFTQNQKLIQEKVFAESSKYLTSYRTSGISNENGMMRMTVVMKIDMTELKSALSRHRLMGANQGGAQRAMHLIIRRTSGLVLFDQLRSELQNQVPEFSDVKERAITKSSIEFLVNVGAQARLAPGRFLQIQSKRCEMQIVDNDKIECDLN